MRFKAAQFFAATHGLTWLFLVPFAVLQWSVNEFPHNLLFLAGGLGPLIATVIMVRRTGDRTYTREYLSRIFCPKRISPRWWCVILLLPFAVTLSGILLAAAFTGAPVRFAGLINTDTIARISVFYVLLMLLAPVLEEVAWRGYGQDALQSRFGLATASLILGMLWWGWHLPLFFMADTYQSQLGLFTPESAEFLVWCVASTFIMTWIYNGTRGSILAAIIYHLMLNLANELLITTLPAEFARSALQVALALLIFMVLSRAQRGPKAMVDNPWRPGSLE